MNAVTSMPKNVAEEAWSWSRQMAAQNGNFDRDHDEKPLDRELTPCFLVNPNDRICLVMISREPTRPAPLSLVIG